MPDIFGRQVNYGGSFAADSAQVILTGLGPGNQRGLLLIQVNINYGQNVTRLYALESNDTYFVAGRTEGTLSAQRVVGPAPILVEFYQKYGDVCRMKDNNMVFSFNTGCGSRRSEQSHLTLNHCVITSLAFSVGSENMVLGETLNVMFAFLEAKTGAAAPAQSPNPGPTTPTY